MSIEKIELFAVPVYKIKCTYHNDIKSYMNKHAVSKYNTSLKQIGTQDIFTDYLPGSGIMLHWPYILEKYRVDVNKILTTIGWDLSQGWDIRLKGWFNITENNTAEWVHDHVGGSSNINYSFVHYISDNSNSTVFLDPNYKLIRSTMPTKNMDYLPSCYLNQRVQVNVEEGDILFFPSWLDHTAPMHTSGDLRVTNAVNVMMRINDEDGY